MKDDELFRRVAIEWAKVDLLLPEPLRARIQDYHTEGVKALLEFHTTVGEILGEKE